MAAEKQNHSVAKTHLSIAQLDLADSQSAFQFADCTEVECLLNDRDNVLQALDSVLDFLDPSFPAFALGSDGFSSSVRSFSSTVFSE